MGSVRQISICQALGGRLAATPLRQGRVNRAGRLRDRRRLRLPASTPVTLPTLGARARISRRAPRQRRARNFSATTLDGVATASHRLKDTSPEQRGAPVGKVFLLGPSQTANSQPFALLAGTRKRSLSRPVFFRFPLFVFEQRAFAKPPASPVIGGLIPIQRRQQDRLLADPRQPARCTSHPPVNAVRLYL